MATGASLLLPKGLKNYRPYFPVMREIGCWILFGSFNRATYSSLVAVISEDLIYIYFPSL